ncbi:phage-related minor tail protein, partial [Ewingella americana]
NTPTMFAFAQGAGVFGEAGPEAIMPLTRAADGSLGVRAVGGGNSAATGGGAPQVYITIEGNGNANAQSTGGWEQFGTQIANFVNQLYQQNKVKDLRQGGDIWNAIKGTR